MVITIKRRAFTLMEVFLVLVIMALLATIVTSSHRYTARKARESVLRHNLAEVRLVLDQYNTDKGRYPEDLQVLVDEGYLRELPLDPITESRETWELIYESDYADEDTSYIPGLFDIKSGSAEQALDGSFYYEW